MRAGSGAATSARGAITTAACAHVRAASGCARAVRRVRRRRREAGCCAGSMPISNARTCSALLLSHHSHSALAGHALRPASARGSHHGDQRCSCRTTTSGGTVYITALASSRLAWRSAAKSLQLSPLIEDELPFSALPPRRTAAHSFRRRAGRVTATKRTAQLR